MELLKFGLPVSPAKLEKTEEIKVKKVIISYGGGMGGSTATYYSVKTTETEDLLKIELINGRKINLRKNFIVSDEDVVLVKITADTTEHSNYYQKRYKKTKSTEYYMVYPSHQKYTVLNEYFKAAQEPILKELDTVSL